VRHWLRSAGIQLSLALLPVAVFLVPGLYARIPAGEAARQALAYIPPVILLAVGLLGWKLHQTRILVACLLQIGSWAVLRLPAAPILGTLLGSHAAEVIPIFLPLGLSVAYLIRECPLFSSRSVERAGAALTPLLAIVWMVNWAPDSYGVMAQWKIGFLDGLTAVPHAALVTAAAFALAAAFQPDARIRGFLAAQVVALIPVFFAAHLDLKAGPDAFRTDLVFLAAAAVLFHAMFAMYWSRVYLDELTGIPNRRALNDRLQSAPEGYALAMVDIDHFKDFNDTFGHTEGDNALRLVAAHLNGEFGTDAHRYGGEEFCIVFEGKDVEEAAELVDGARKRLAQRTFHIRADHHRRIDDRGKAPEPGGPEGRTVSITFSAGVTASREDDTAPEMAIRRADAALYRAKDAGRDRVVTDRKA
jgi:diguanylate cyclase (GGDEF)-like protein